MKFYGLGDYGTYFQVARAAEILEHYDPTSTTRTISDILELYNAQLFAESGRFPTSYTDDQRAAAQAVIPELRKTVGKFFNTISDVNVASLVVDVEHEYHADLLQHFSTYKVYSRCTAAVLLPVLDSINVDIGELLTNKDLVASYDQELRTRLLACPTNAEHVIRKYLEKDSRRDVRLPASFASIDARRLLDDYLDSDDANPNFVELISLARLNKDMGLTRS